MSQESRNNQGNEKDINRVTHNDGERKNYESFEGMNYEQLRQPFNPNQISRNRSKDKRNDSQRPEER